MPPRVRPWGGLRFRVALLTTLVAAASVSAMAWYAGHVSANAWRRQFTPTPRATLARIADAVARAVGPGAPDWTRAARPLASGLAETGKQLIVFDSTRHAVAAAPPGLLRLDITLGVDGTVSWQRVLTSAPTATDSGGEQRTILRQRAIVGNPRLVPVVRGPGAAPATLVEIAAALSLDTPGDPLIVGMLRRPLLVGLGVAIVGAVLVALALSARVAAPIERLTHATRAVAAGARAVVPERGSAEVAALARAFNAMTAELERQEALRRGMTSDIAHELRSPLTNIRCQIEAILDGIDAPTPATLASLHEECLGLQQLIDDLQDMTYGDQGRLTLDIETVDLPSELEAALRPFQQRAALAGTALRIASPASAAVRADRRRFRQVVGNLVSNALTHTPHGCVTVAVEPRSDGFVAVEVRDTGAGIPADALPNVFERFYRADPSRARTGGGAGLGLAIVKQLVELQGGRVSITSEVGKGTTVRFTVPRS